MPQSTWKWSRPHSRLACRVTILSEVAPSLHHLRTPTAIPVEKTTPNAASAAPRHHLEEFLFHIGEEEPCTKHKIEADNSRRSNPDMAKNHVLGRYDGGRDA